MGEAEVSKVNTNTPKSKAVKEMARKKERL